MRTQNLLIMLILLVALPTTTLTQENKKLPPKRIYTKTLLGRDFQILFHDSLFAVNKNAQLVAIKHYYKSDILNYIYLDEAATKLINKGKTGALFYLMKDKKPEESYYIACLFIQPGSARIYNYDLQKVWRINQDETIILSRFDRKKVTYLCIKYGNHSPQS